ncbi:MAG TPA: alpha/beta hydrolase-fold protein [Anaerolineaceae bacterium]|nr:alpha/beta hydrolase-fold protein [Anaerolineaceae bacterium]
MRLSISYRSRLVAWMILCLALLVGCALGSSAGQPTQADLAQTVQVAQSPDTTRTPFLPEIDPSFTPVLPPTPILRSTVTPTLEPSLTPTQDLSACLAAGGRFEIGGPLPYRGMPEGLSFRVYLPPCYDIETARRYPVLYLIHGQSSTDDQWDRLGADEVADRLIASGEAPPFLIVMPRDRVWVDPDGDRFGLAVMDQLLPWIDSHYRIQADRAHRAIGGLSRGGAWALHLGLTHWESFGAWGEHSGVVFASDAPLVFSWIKAIPPEEMPPIYLDDGEGDRWLYSMKDLKKILDQAGVDYTWVLRPGYHNEEYWHAHVDEYLRWYASHWVESSKEQ